VVANELSLLDIHENLGTLVDTRSFLNRASSILHSDGRCAAKIRRVVEISGIEIPVDVVVRLKNKT
jgi:hypothetical protein